ncbi:trypsin-like [Anthonomus grandis grandis]|uniref:trypsin-like n=1 Tax=Anthonomus grandis grandis TaxID=2921223 RepID=UPI00216563FF|nr:trypsin-like [Anthonomus grandis grandis]
MQCFSLTTLLVVSLTNLILLIVMILESRKKCLNEDVISDTGFRFGALKGLDKSSAVMQRGVLRDEARSMAALILLKGGMTSLICGTVIISKTWVLTTAHCCELVRSLSFENLKITSNSENWKRGKKRSIENLVRHINYTAKSSAFNVCLIKVGSPFKEVNEQPMPIASSEYRYITDTSASTLGWSSTKSSLYTIDVNLISFQRCRTLVKADHVDETMVCAYNIDTADCRFDSGGPLIQSNIVIGMVSFETNCAKRATARVFTRMSFFQRWFQDVEKQNDVRIGASFKP